MGYSTDFFGEVRVEPPLNPAEIAWLTKFSETRRMHMKQGPYFVDNGGEAGQADGIHVVDYNEPPPGQPGLWCQWVPDASGSALRWNGYEKFYEADAWLQYLIDHFLEPKAKAKASRDPQFHDFTFDHHVSGRILASGEEFPDLWRIDVLGGRVAVTAYESEVPFDVTPSPSDALYELARQPASGVVTVEKMLRALPNSAKHDGFYAFLTDLAQVLPAEAGEALRRALSAY